MKYTLYTDEFTNESDDKKNIKSTAIQSLNVSKQVTPSVTTEKVVEWKHNQGSHQCCKCTEIKLK